MATGVLGFYLVGQHDQFLYSEPGTWGEREITHLNVMLMCSTDVVDTVRFLLDEGADPNGQYTNMNRYLYTVLNTSES